MYNFCKRKPYNDSLKGRLLIINSIKSMEWMAKNKIIDQDLMLVFSSIY